MHGLVPIIYLHHELLKMDDLHNHESRSDRCGIHLKKLLGVEKKDSSPDAGRRSTGCCERLVLLKSEELL